MTTMVDDGLIPETCAEALRRWDAGQSVFTVEMGGLGPGYEQCIHIVAFEVIREVLSRPEPPPWADKADSDEAKAAMRAYTESVEKVVDEKTKGLGLTGAQHGAAFSLAYRTLRIGWAHALAEVPDRHIQVSQQLPALRSEPEAVSTRVQ